MSTLASQFRQALRMRRRNAARETALYGLLMADVLLLRRRGFGVHVELVRGRKRYRVGNRLLDASALSATAARERRLLGAP